jgi:DMSO/TMAO reductase YedYZ molybdopterin-dependent catalytic subunit
MKLAWVLALAISSGAAAIALVLQSVLRDTWQIRSLPERVMEWLLLFVPLDLFERGLGQFGADAKSFALTGTALGMAAVLVGLGTLALRLGLTSWMLLGLGAAMWLATMVGIMPLTGAGYFGRRLLISPLLTSSGYLVVFLGYASVLMLGRLFALRGIDRRPVMLAERRAVIVGMVGTVVAGATARVVGRDGGLVGSVLPLALPPTPQPATPVPRPVQTPNAQSAVAAAPPVPVAQARRVAAPTLEALPNPPVPRKLSRDKDGSLTAAGRPKGQLAPPITRNEDFFIVTKNAVGDPVVDASTWRLIVDGEVNRPVQVDYRTLRMLPTVEVTKTLECISNFTSGCSLTSFGCDLISTARWKGVRLSDVLDLAGGLKPTAVGLAFLATDEFSAGLTTAVADDPETLLVFEMNGEPLPREHGFPVRLLVPGRYGMKNPKWLAGIRAMNEEYDGWYEQRNWNKDGIIKTMSRIDVPADGAQLTPGEQRVAGIAYAGDRGVQLVEFSSDDGATWQRTRLLEPMPGKDAMVRWEGTFLLGHDELKLTVRATDGGGEIQTAEFRLPQPDGASGRDAITVGVA